MPYIYEKATGNPVNVPHEKVRELLATGQYKLPSADVAMMDSQGRTGTVDIANVMGALEKGYRLLTPEEDNLRGVKGDVITAITGAARGATLGLSDAILAAGKVISPETLRAAQEMNPKLSIASEIGGAVAGAVFSKKVPTIGKISISPVAAASDIGNLVERSVLSGKTGLAAKVFSKIAGGATEGAIWGTGEAISEASLGNADSVGEAIVANVTPLAIIGGVAGGTLGTAGELFSKGVRKTATKLSDKVAVMAKEAQPKLQKKAQDELFMSMGLSPKQVTALKNKPGKGEKWAESAFKTITEEPVFADGTPIFHGGLKDFSEEGLLKRFNEALGESWNMRAQAIKNIDDAAGVAGDVLAADANKIASRINREIISQIRPKGGIKSEMEGLIKQIEQQADGPLTFDELFKWGDQVGAKGWTAGVDNKSAEFYRQFETIMREARHDLMEQGAKKYGLGSAFEEYKKANKIFAATRDLVRKSEISGGEGGSGLFSKVMGRGAAGLAWGWNYGPIATAARFAGASLIGSTVMGKAVSHGTKANIYNKLATLKNLDSIAQKTQARIDTAIKTFEKSLRAGTRVGKPTTYTILKRIFGESSKEKIHEKLEQEVSSFVADPQAAADKIAANTAALDGVADNVATSVAATTTRGMQYLHSKLPPKRPNRLQPFLKEKRNAAHDLRFAQAAVGAFDPVSVMEDAQHGHISRPGLDAVKAVYPNAYAAWTQKMLAVVAALDYKLPYNTEILLSIILGQPVNSSLESPNIMRTQQMYAQAQAPKGQGPQGASLQGMKKLDFGSEYLTRAQRMEQPV